MEIVLKKQPVKYLACVDKNTRSKLYRAIDGLKELNGNIVKLKDCKNMYRLKIAHFRIIFSINAEDIIIEMINTRTNIKY